MSMSGTFLLSVGPLLYYWPRNELIAFYARIAEAPVHTVYLGEVICSRRHEMKTDDWIDLAHDMKAAGKEVVLSSQALIESETELRALRRFAECDEFLIEANEAAAVRLAAGRPFVIGPHVNVYSAPALDEFAAAGAVRWVPPLEVPIDAFALVNPATRTPAVETEAFVFGRMGLAFSARCFTARHYQRNRDDCDFRCIEHPDGLALKTQEGDPFLALNGLQTQSARTHCLIGERANLIQAGVRRIRLSPVAQGFERVIDAFDQVFNHGADAAAALQDLAPWLPGQPADGYAHRRPGYEWSHA